MKAVYLWWQSKEFFFVLLKEIYWHFKRMWNYRYIYINGHALRTHHWRSWKEFQTLEIPLATYYTVYIKTVFTHTHTHINRVNDGNKLLSFTLCLFTRSLQNPLSLSLTSKWYSFYAQFTKSHNAAIPLK
jgi:hypothetical protein